MVHGDVCIGRFNQNFSKFVMNPNNFVFQILETGLCQRNFHDLFYCVLVKKGLKKKDVPSSWFFHGELWDSGREIFLNLSIFWDRLKIGKGRNLRIILDFGTKTIVDLKTDATF